MTRSTLACCLWGAATITAAAAAAAVQASMVNRRIDRAYVAMARAFITRPDDGEQIARLVVNALDEAVCPDVPAGSRPGLVVLHGGEDSP